MDQRPAVKTVVVIDQIVPPNSPKVSALHKALREKAEKEMFGKFLEEHKEYVKDKKDKKN